MRLNKLVTLIFGSLLFVFLLLAIRCVYLQVYRHDHYSGILERQQKITIPENGQRGVIVDTRARYVAVSKLQHTVFADPAILKDYKGAAAKLQDILEMPGHKICETILEKPNSRYVKIKTGITTEQREAILNEKIYGIGIDKKWKRVYPMGRLFSHVVGLEALKPQWCEGLERWYYDTLSGLSGSSSYLVDTFRKPIGIADEPMGPVMGTSLILTLDSTIQKFAREALVAKCREYNAESGITIVMEPNTGAILAMVCYPDFDPVDISSDPSKRRNRALTDPYEPGSIFKPIFTALALDMGVIGKHTNIYCEKGSYSGKGFGRIGEYGYHSYGNLTPDEILVHSSNIGMAKMGQIMERKYGKKKMYDAIKLFGFGEKTGIDLPGESAGILNPVKRWNGYSITRIPYGQEISVTAIQIARAYCILANGGRPVIPHVVKAFVDSNGDTIKVKNNPTQVGYIIKPEIADWIIKKALVKVVKEGTGKKAALKDYTVFGKTGTANVAVNGTYDNQSYVASFAGGAPAEDPQIVVLTSIRKPDRSLGKGYTGGTVTGPVVAQVIQKTLDYLNNRSLLEAADHLVIQNTDPQQ